MRWKHLRVPTPIAKAMHPKRNMVGRFFELAKQPEVLRWVTSSH